MAYYEVAKERIKVNLCEGGGHDPQKGGGHDPPKKTPLAPRHSYSAQCYKMVIFATLKVNSIFLVEFSGNIGRNSFLTSIANQKIFRLYFQKSRLEYYFFVSLLLFESLF